MAFIDWSDSENLLDLLVEFVSDERNESRRDLQRHKFLTDLLSELGAVREQIPAISRIDAVNQLQKIYESLDREFIEDPVVAHLSACIEELQNIADGMA